MYTQFKVYNKNAKGLSVVTGISASGNEVPLFSAASVTQSRKALGEFKKLNSLHRVPVTTLLNEGYEANSASMVAHTPATTSLVKSINATRPAPKFSVAERFEMMEQITRMVVTGQQRAELITGCGGTGKTYNVLDVLKSEKMEMVALGALDESGKADDDEGEVVELTSKHFLKITGAVSPMGLYRALYENCNSVLVFDDCDSVFGNANSINILKAVLDTTGDGTVSWSSPAVQRAGLPMSFKFNGKVIFISNRKTAQIPQPLLSRSLILDMDMTPEDICERARMLNDQLLPKLTQAQRNELFDFVEANLTEFRDVSLRLYVLSAPFLMAGLSNWRELTMFTN